MNFESRAGGLTTWVNEGAAPAEVAAVLVTCDRDAVLWHVAKLVLDAAQIAHIERTTITLMAGGYEPSM